MIKTLIRDYGVGAIVLFKRNVVNATQLQVKRYLILKVNWAEAD